jgi:hypothetical protein
MNVLLNNAIIFLFILIIYKIGTSSHGRCKNIHYVPLYSQYDVKDDEDNEEVKINNIKRPRHVRTRTRTDESTPLFNNEWLNDLI